MGCDEGIEGCDPPGERLHPSTVWLPFMDGLSGLIVSAIVALFFTPVFLFWVVLPGIVLVSLGYQIYVYLTFRFRVTRAELILDSGIVSRRERRIPFDRIQETRIRQGLWHRMLNLASLEITTAGSDAEEARLNVITRQRAESLEAAIRSVGQTSTGSILVAQAADYQCRLSYRELVLGGLTSTVVTAIGAVLAAILYFQLFVGVGSRWMESTEQKVDRKLEQRIPQELSDSWLGIRSRVPDLGPLDPVVDFYFDDTLAKSLSLAALGMIGSVLAYVVRYHGYQFTRKSDLLTTTYGLLTRHYGSLPRDRIQALKMEEGILRRPFNLVSIRVDSAGDRHEIEEAKKRDVLVPVADKRLAEEVARQAIPGVNDWHPQWKRISRLAIMRGSKKWWLLLALAVGQTYWLVGWYCLAWLPVFPLVYFLNWQGYRNTGYWLGESHFLSRRGWLNRATTCIPIKNVQNVSTRQNLFDRRLGLATLSIDTAGQSNTGGGPVLRHLPLEDAVKIRQTIASRVAASGISW